MKKLWVRTGAFVVGAFMYVWIAWEILAAK
jgi:hypothetical protein